MIRFQFPLPYDITATDSKIEVFMSVVCVKHDGNRIKDNFVIFAQKVDNLFSDILILIGGKHWGCIVKDSD